MNRAEIVQKLIQDNPDAILFEGLDNAIIGMGSVYSQPLVAIYSDELIIQELMKNNEWDRETAVEWFDFNIACAYMGEGTPIIATIGDDDE